MGYCPFCRETTKKKKLNKNVLINLNNTLEDKGFKVALEITFTVPLAISVVFCF